MIEYRNVVCGYGGHTVLSNVNFTLNKGELVFVIGKNGCGKSTLLKAGCGLLKLTAGQVTCDGARLWEMKPRERAKKIAYLAQGKTVPDMTVFEAVLHGRFPYITYPHRYSEEDSAIARAAIEKLGMGDFADRMMSTLSGGMRQRVYIAMALCQNAEYIMLDEPSAFLDISWQLELVGILKSLAAQGHGIAAVIHDIPMAFSNGNRVAVLDNGQIKAFDTPQVLYEQKTVDEVLGVTFIRESDGGYRYKY